MAAREPIGVDLSRFIAFSDDTCNKLQALNSTEDGWIARGESEGVQMWARAVKDSAIEMLKGVRVVNGNPRKLADKFFILEAPGTLSEWDDTFLLCQSIYQHTGPQEIKIDLLQSRLPWPVWPRDFVLLNSRKVVDEAIFQYQRSVEYIDLPPQPETYVRGDITLSGFVFTPGDEGATLETSKTTKITRILHLDPKGAIPKWLINLQGKKQVAQFINHMATLITDDE